MAKHSGGTRMGRPISGTTIGGNNVISAGAGTGGGNWNANTPAQIRAAEESIRSNTFETAFAFTPSGELIASSKGGSNSVSLPIGIPSGSVITHNHPSGSSFSKQDILTATSMNVSEIRAVGSKRVYSLKRPSTGWGDRAKLIPAISRAEIRTRERLTNYIRRGQMISEAEGRRRIQQANILHTHLLWKDVSKQMGYDYKRANI